MVERSGRIVFMGLGHLTDQGVDRWRIEVGPAENNDKFESESKTSTRRGFLCPSGISFASFSFFVVFVFVTFWNAVFLFYLFLFSCLVCLLFFDGEARLELLWARLGSDRLNSPWKPERGISRLCRIANSCRGAILSLGNLTGWR